MSYDERQLGDELKDKIAERLDALMDAALEVGILTLQAEGPGFGERIKPPESAHEAAALIMSTIMSFPYNQELMTKAAWNAGLRYIRSGKETLDL